MNIIEMFEDKHGSMEMARDRNLWAEQLIAFREGWEARGIWDDETTKKYNTLLSDREILSGEKEEGE
jgi:hypothetical protein